MVVSPPLDMHLVQEKLDHIANFLRNLLTILHRDHTNLNFQQECKKLLFSTLLPAFIIFCLFSITVLRWDDFIVVLTHIYLKTNEVKYIFRNLLAIWISFEKYWFMLKLFFIVCMWMANSSSSIRAVISPRFTTETCQVNFSFLWTTKDSFKFSIILWINASVRNLLKTESHTLLHKYCHKICPKRNIPKLVLKKCY